MAMFMKIFNMQNKIGTMKQTINVFPYPSMFPLMSKCIGSFLGKNLYKNIDKIDGEIHKIDEIINDLSIFLFIFITSKLGNP